MDKIPQISYSYPMELQRLSLKQVALSLMLAQVLWLASVPVLAQEDDDEPPALLPSNSSPNFPPPTDFDDEEFEEIETDEPISTGRFRPPEPPDMDTLDDGGMPTPPQGRPFSSRGSRSGGGGNFSTGGDFRFSIAEGEFYERGKKRGRTKNRPK